MKTKIVVLFLLVALKLPFLAFADGVPMGAEHFNTERGISMLLSKMPYPLAAQNEKVEGMVSFVIEGDANGIVQLVEIAGSDELLIDGVKEYLQKNKFEIHPGSQVLLRVKFTLL